MDSEDPTASAGPTDSAAVAAVHQLALTQLLHPHTVHHPTGSTMVMVMVTVTATPAHHHQNTVPQDTARKQRLKTH